MDYQNALNILAIKTEEPETSDILKAFNKLSRRYPQSSFPQRYSELVQAKELLLNRGPVISFKDYFVRDFVDMTFANRHLKQQDPTPQSEVTQEKKELQEFARVFFSQGPERFLSADFDEDLIPDFMYDLFD